MLIATFLIGAALAAEPSALNASPSKITNPRGTAILFTPPKGQVEAYIKNRHALIGHLSREYPRQRFEAQVSFWRYLPAFQLPQLLEEMEVRVISLDFGWDGQGGGFAVEGNEPLEESLETLHRYHGEFLGHLHETVSLIEEETSRPDKRPGDEQRLAEHLDHIHSLSAAYQEHGVLLVGMKVTGRPEDLVALINKEPVRLVDPLWDEFSDASGAEVKKLSAPIPPEQGPISAREGAPDD